MNRNTRTRAPSMQYKAAYRSANQGAQSLQFEVVAGPAHLPDPGIPVFIRTREGLPSHNRIGVLRDDGKTFTLARFFTRKCCAERINVDAVTGWDYAVPAGDML